MARNDKLVQVDGAAIEARRLALGLTRDEFATEAGMSANTVLATERGYRDPSERTAAKITAALDRLEAAGTEPEMVPVPARVLDQMFQEIAALRRAVEALEADLGPR